jgi:hypothetical protein
MTSERKKAYMKKWRAENKARIKESRKAYYDANRDKAIADAVSWSKTHREEDRAKCKAYRDNPKNKERILAYRRKYYHEKVKFDPALVVKSRLRCRLRRAIKTNAKRGSAVSDLGCSVPQLLQHLEQQFADGMNWDNWGEWHIDHIKPLYKFDLLDREQFLEAVHFTNLQPLWAIDNYKKNRYEQ